MAAAAFRRPKDGASRGTITTSTAPSAHSSKPTSTARRSTYLLSSTIYALRAETIDMRSRVAAYGLETSRRSMSKADPASEPYRTHHAQRGRRRNVYVGIARGAVFVHLRDRTMPSKADRPSGRMSRSSSDHAIALIVRIAAALRFVFSVPRLDLGLLRNLCEIRISRQVAHDELHLGALPAQHRRTESLGISTPWQRSLTPQISAHGQAPSPKHHYIDNRSRGGAVVVAQRSRQHIGLLRRVRGTRSRVLMHESGYPAVPVSSGSAEIRSANSIDPDLYIRSGGRSVRRWYSARRTGLRLVEPETA